LNENKQKIKCKAAKYLRWLGSQRYFRFAPPTPPHPHQHPHPTQFSIQIAPLQ